MKDAIPIIAVYDRVKDRTFYPFPAKPAYNYMNVFFSYPYTVFSKFYYETDHRKFEMTLGGRHCGLRFFKLGRPLHTGFERRSPA